MSVIKKISDLTTLAIGYFLGAPDDRALHPFNTILSSSFSVSQSVIDESVKAMVALFIAVASRWIWNLFEKPKRKRPTPRKNIKPVTMPESLTLNKKADETQKVSEQVGGN